MDDLTPVVTDDITTTVIQDLFIVIKADTETKHDQIIEEIRTLADKYKIDHLTIRRDERLKGVEIR